MRRYVKPESGVKGYQSSERFADLWKDIFKTGNQIPGTVYTMSGDSSAA